MAKTEYRFDPDTFHITGKMKATFDDLGYILLRDLLDKEEVYLVTGAAESEGMQKEAYAVPDANRILNFVTVWSQTGNDVTGMVARSKKVAGTVEKLLGGEIYHYYSKILMKDAFTGGRIEWHQDYGYWYQNGLLFPNCITVFIALDKSTKQNGCLQVLPGSHKCGRIDHHRIQGQATADNSRVEEIKKKCQLEFIEMEPGDALFFHGNTLHTSDPNTSPSRRWALACCYNMASNNPVIQHHHSSYVSLEMVPNNAIKTCQSPYDFTGKKFLDPANVKKGQLRYIRRGEGLDVLRDSKNKA